MDEDDKTLQSVWKVTDGDLRKAISMLQSAQLFHDEGEQLTLESIREISGVCPYYLDLMH
jgi:replication-associated recombination protein RarA